MYSSLSGIGAVPLALFYLWLYTIAKTVTVVGLIVLQLRPAWRRRTALNVLSVGVGATSAWLELRALHRSHGLYWLLVEISLFWCGLGIWRLLGRRPSPVVWAFVVTVLSTVLALQLRSIPRITRTLPIAPLHLVEMGDDLYLLGNNHLVHRHANGVVSSAALPNLYGTIAVAAHDRLLMACDDHRCVTLDRHVGTPRSFELGQVIRLRRSPIGFEVVAIQARTVVTVRLTSDGQESTESRPLPEVAESPFFSVYALSNIPKAAKDCEGDEVCNWFRTKRMEPLDTDWRQAEPADHFAYVWRDDDVQPIQGGDPSRRWRRDTQDAVYVFSDPWFLYASDSKEHWSVATRIHQGTELFLLPFGIRERRWLAIEDDGPAASRENGEVEYAILDGAGQRLDRTSLLDTLARWLPALPVWLTLLIASWLSGLALFVVTVARRRTQHAATAVWIYIQFLVGALLAAVEIALLL
jgi:hypothetical protein